MKSGQTIAKSDAKKPKLWQKASYVNLIRYVPSGVYFLRIRVRGKLIRKSLKTDVLSVAKLRLTDEEKKYRHLPDNTKFVELVQIIQNAGGRFSHDCADLVRFLAYGGFRLGEAGNITWADCDFKKEEIVVRGDSDEGTKNSEVRRAPMIAEMRQLLERLRETHHEDMPATRVMRVSECQKAMDAGVKKVGVSHLTHHDLRHLFATRCIESGVDIPTVSRWLGHKDGGGLAMKVYGHLRNQHSTSMAKLVSFEPINVVPLRRTKL
jgi:integrase